MGALELLDRAVDAGANLFDVSLGGGVLDDAAIPRSVIDSGPQRTVYRYRRGGRARDGAPVLLIPPLAAPASCFDLRRGASLAEHDEAGATHDVAEAGWSAESAPAEAA
jgi:polyhydroxyalkanoate synthase